MTFEQSDATMVIPSLGRQGYPRQELDFEILAGHLRHTGTRVRVIDAQFHGMDEQQLLEEIQNSRAGLVYWHIPFRREYRHVARLSKSVRSALSVSIQVAGGNFAVWNDLAVLSNLDTIDGVLYGEPELVLESVLRDVKEGKPWREQPGLTVRRSGTPTRNPARELIENLDSLPMAIPDLFHTTRLEHRQKILLGRGCNSDCQYCGLQTFYKNSYTGRSRFWRTRSPKLIVDEIQYYSTKMHASFFEFNSFVFFGYDSYGSSVIQNIAEELLARRLQIRFSFITHPGPLCRNQGLLPLLKRAGLDHVSLGVDSCLERVLKLYNVPFGREDILPALQILHKFEIPFNTLFIFYDPYLTLDEIDETLLNLRKWAPFYKHMEMPFSFFLDREMLNSTLRIDTHIPLAGRLAADQLLRTSDSYESITIAFQNSTTQQFFRIHQLCSIHIVSKLREVLYDRAIVARIPDLEFFPLELLGRISSILRRTPNISIDTALQELMAWSKSYCGQLLECGDAGKRAVDCLSQT